MGASSSKPSGTTPPYVWKGSSATSVSQDMIESLQSSSETDTSRSQLAELQVQARVASELRRLQAAEDARLTELTEKFASESIPEQTTTSRHEVSKEIQALRSKLEKRPKKLKEIPESLDNARSEVVRCLRENDRRPLDCYREVERFKEEVRRLEKGWVERTIS